jgi:hypothetical protein
MLNVLFRTAALRVCLCLVGSFMKASTLRTCRWWSSPGILAASWVLGVPPLKIRTDSDCRWSGSVFEALVFFPHYHWLAWVDQCQINFKYPVSISYNRLHHRAVESTQTGSLNQEKVMVRFRQQIVDVRVIALGLKIAKANRCL